MLVTKLLRSPVKKDFLPKNDPIWPKIGIFAHCWLIWCPVGGLAGGCGAGCILQDTYLLYVLNTWGNKLLLLWWPWFFYRLGREMVTYLVPTGSTPGSPLFLTHWRGIMGWSSVHGKRRENIKKASGVKGFCRKKLLFLCCPDGPSDNDKDHLVRLPETYSFVPPPHPS